MKTKKNFLKKLTAGILGFVMTLGVGAAGYSASTSEARAADELLSTLIFGGGGKTSSYSATFYETCDNYEYTIRNFNNNQWNWSSTVSGANKTIKGGSKTAAWSGTIETPKFSDKISKVQLYISATSSNVTSITLYSGASAGAKTNSLGTFTKSIGAQDVTISSPTGNLFYTIEAVGTKASSNGFLAVDYVKYYKQQDTSKVLTSVVVSGTPTKTSYIVGDAFDPSGLTVTGHYNDGSSSPIESEDINWNSNPSVLNSAGTVSVSVTATVSGVTSAAYAVNNITVLNVKTATYTVASKSSVNKTGTAPTGSSATFSNSGSNGDDQMISGITQTLTLSGYSGYIIKGITLHMKSNSKAGAGTFSAVAGSTTLASISSGTTFNKWFDNTSYGTSYRDVHVTMSNTTYELATGENLVITMVGTTNSIYCNEYSIIYEAGAPKHTVTYYAGDGASGTVPTQSPVSEDGEFTVAQGTGLSKTGYTFAGWKDGNGTPYAAGSTYTMGTSDVTLTAQWSISSFALSYNANGGSGTVAGGNHEYNSTFNLSSSTFTKSGYTQDGWATSTSGAKAYDLDGSYTMPANDVTLYAHWKANQYTITYNANGGSGEVADQTADYNSSVTLASSGFSKDHYTFDGYATSSTGSVAYEKGATITMPLNGLSLYAHYTIQSHTVIYNGNGGTPDKASDTVDYGEPVDVTVGASLTGYHLLGWSIDGSTVETNLTMGDANIELIAVWEQDTATYSFTAYANDGSATSSLIGDQYHNGDQLTMPNPSTLGFTRTGYTALGWATSSSATEVEYAVGATEYMGDSDFNIYVVWQKHLAANPVLTFSDSMWVGETQELTVTYTPGAETLNVTSSAPSVVSIASKSVDVTNGINKYTLTAVSEGSATITAGDSFYSQTGSITTTNDEIYSVSVSGAITGTHYVGDSLKISDIKSMLTTSGVMKSGGAAAITQSNVTYTFNGGGTSTTLTSGQTNVSVIATYEGVSSSATNISITVTDVELDHITVTPDSSQITYTIGDEFEYSDAKVKGVNNNGSQFDIDVSDCTFVLDSDSAMLKANTPTVTVTHLSSGKSTTYTITVNAKQIKTTTTYTLVSDVSYLSIGDRIVLVSHSDGEYALSTNQASSNRTGTAVTKANNQITWESTSSVEILTLEAGTNTGQFALKASGGYLYASSSTGNQLKTQTNNNDNGSWTISISSNVASITANGTNSRKVMQYNPNNNSPLFACYASASQKGIEIYKEEKQSSGTKSLAGITATFSHDGDYYVGQSVSINDFTVKAWYNDDSSDENVSGFTITDPTLYAESNQIQLNYTDSTGTKSCNVTVPAVQRTATVESVYVVAQSGYKTEYYQGDDTLAWDFTNIKLQVNWSEGDPTYSNLGDFVALHPECIDPAVPSIGVTEFTIEGEYMGVEIDSEHNSVSGISVVAKQVSSLSWPKRFDGVDLNFFAGEKINKSQFAKQNSTSYIKATYNDGEVVEKFSIDNCSVALYRRVNNENVKVKDVMFDADGNYTFTAEDNGLYFLLSAGTATTTYSDASVLHVIPSLNNIIAPGGPSETITLDYDSFDYNLPSSAGTAVDTVALEDDETMEFEYLGVYNYSSHIALPKTSGDYFKNKTAWYGDITSITIKKTGTQSVNAASTLYFSKDNVTWDSGTLINNPGTDGQKIDAPTGGGYRYFKIVTNGTNYTNLGKIEITYSNDTNIANTNKNAQEKVIDYVNNNLGNLTSASWSTASSNYSSMLTNAGDDSTVAANLLKYASENATGDVLQQFVKAYDDAVKANKLTNFLNRKIVCNIAISINGEIIEDTCEYDGTYELPEAPSKSGYLFKGWDVNGTTYAAGAKISNLEEDLNVKAIMVQDMVPMTLTTEANYKFETNNAGAFTKVTQTSLRMYLSIEEDTYEYYSNLGYNFSIIMHNESNGKDSSISGSKINVRFENGYAIFDINLNIPTAQISTELTLKLVASDGVNTVQTATVTTSFEDAAIELFFAYQEDPTILDQAQYDALCAILGE